MIVTASSPLLPAGCPIGRAGQNKKKLSTRLPAGKTLFQRKIKLSQNDVRMEQPVCSAAVAVPERLACAAARRANVAARNAFLASLQNSGVRYQFGGHDHMHHRAIITSPDANARVQEIITSSTSYKFYIPQIPSNDGKYNVPAVDGTREPPQRRQ